MSDFIIAKEVQYRTYASQLPMPHEGLGLYEYPVAERPEYYQPHVASLENHNMELVLCFTKKLLDHGSY